MGKQDDQIREKMSQSSAFAEALNKDKTFLFFDFLQYKPTWREPVGIEIMGATRSGKSTVGIAVCKFLGHITLVPFNLWNICPNEIVYLQKLKTPQVLDGSSFLIDEQTETHAGAGSYTEMQLLEDIQNICAKKQINTTWAHPHEFVGRMSQLGLCTYGKDPENLLVRTILYNIAQTALTKTPMGIVIIPVGQLFPCGLFGKKITYLGRETVITCNKRVCSNYDVCDYFMGKYEHLKDKQIEDIRTQDFHEREFQRIEVIEQLASNPVFQQCKNNDERMSIARLLVPYGTPEKLIKELIMLAKSKNIAISDLRDIQEKNREMMKKLIKEEEKKAEQEAKQK